MQPPGTVQVRTILFCKFPKDLDWEDEWEGGRVKNIFRRKLGWGCVSRGGSTGGTGDKQEVPSSSADTTLVTRERGIWRFPAEENDKNRSQLSQEEKGGNYQQEFLHGAGGEKRKKKKRRRDLSEPKDGGKTQK